MKIQAKDTWITIPYMASHPCGSSYVGPTG